jgi:predicted nucleic acid-binding protein
LRYVFVDSSAFLALEDPAEQSHPDVRAALQQLVRSRARLVSSNFVFDESYTLILSRLGRNRAVTWGESFMRGKLVELLRVGEDHERRAWEIILAFEDKEFSYTDATSFAVSESMGIREALSLDRHFREYGQLQVIP